MEFGNDQEPWSPKIDSSELVLVHCTTSLFNGNENMDVFDLDQQLSLALMKLLESRTLWIWHSQEDSVQVKTNQIMRFFIP
jgi:hypothetical protein